MMTVKARVGMIFDRQVILEIVGSQYDGKTYRIPPGPAVQEGQLVELDIHLGGIRASWHKKE